MNVDPLAPARAVQSPEIEQVLSLRSGKIWDARHFITRHRYEDLVRVRSRVLEAMNAGAPRLVCSLCHKPVYIVASPIKAFFFRHKFEDGSCPAITRGTYTQDQIRARQYAGVQESEAHRRLKQLLVQSIEADRRFHQLTEETTWRSTIDFASLRRPDVSCAFRGLRIAFEAQLSTTFLSVVVARRSFYRDEGALLVWVLSSFDPNRRRMTEEDIIFPNNSNVLVVDYETAAASVLAGRFMTRCWYRSVRTPAGTTEWCSELVGFDQLTLEVANQRAFFVDVERQERALQEEARAAYIARLAWEEETLRADFLSHWTGAFDAATSYEDRQRAWSGLARRFAEREIKLPPHCCDDQQLDLRLKIVLSAKTGKPVGWRYKGLLDIAHHLYDKHPEALLLFGHLLKLYGHADCVQVDDKTGSWIRKANVIRQEINRGSLRYASHVVWEDLLTFLFPEAGLILKPALAAA